MGLFIQSLNQTIDLHSTRVVAGLYSRVPVMVWIALYSLTAVSMLGFGYHAGLTSTRRSFSFLILAITFAAVLSLVADLDRPQAGTLRVSQQAIIDLRTSMDGPN